jgi:hypothetical protein
MRIDTSKQLWDLIEARYPFLRVKQYKADTEKMRQRVLTEYRARKRLVDVLNSTPKAPTMESHWPGMSPGKIR